jgi:hypothetical protein
MQGDMSALLEAGEVDHCDDQRRDREDALMQDRQHEGADVQHRRIMDTLDEHLANWLGLVVVVLHFVEQAEDCVPFHASGHVGIGPDVAMEEMQR